MIGIISDTHDNLDLINKAVKIFKEKNVELILHLGDTVAPGILKHFPNNTKYVLGNCDGDILKRKQVVDDMGQELLGELAELNINGKKFFLYHGTHQMIINIAADTQKYDYILHGHTHKRRDEKIGKTRILNPGAFYPTGEKSIILLDPKTDKVEFIDL